jgi:chromosome segregation ATPase
MSNKPWPEWNQDIERGRVMKHKLPPLSDRALQSLRNAGNEAEEAADEIEALRSRIAELEAQNTQLTASLEKASAACIVLKQQQREGWAKLDTGEFIPASELNQRIDMRKKLWPEWN